MKNKDNIAIIGTTGSGKTHLARAIAAATGRRFVDLDDLFWQPDWAESSDARMAAEMTAALAADGWVTSGNYTRLRHLVWPRAAVLVWLDYGFCRNLWQLLCRTWRRWRTGEKVCNGNVETLDKIFSRQSIVIWFFRTYFKNRRRYVDMTREHPCVVRLRGRGETARWLQAFIAEEKNHDALHPL